MKKRLFKKGIGFIAISLFLIIFTLLTIHFNSSSAYAISAKTTSVSEEKILNEIDIRRISKMIVLLSY